LGTGHRLVTGWRPAGPLECTLSEQRELPCTSAPDVLFLMLKQSEKNYLIIP